MELHYTIKVQQLASEVLQNSIKEVSETLDAKLFKTDLGVTLKSNSNSISNYFKETTQLVKNMKLSSSYLLGYDEDKSWGYSERGSFEITPEYLETFIKGPDRYNLESLIGDKFEKNISDQDTVNLLSFKENSFSLEPTSKYEISFSDFKVNITDKDEEAKYFLLVFKNNIKYERVSDLFTIPKEQFINLSNDFYQILPSFKKSSYSINTNMYSIEINSSNPLELTSNYNLNFDNYVSNSFYLPPKFKIGITYSENDYTPLNSVEAFNPDFEYVILQLVGDTYKPIYYLSRSFPISADKTEFNLLMQSHSEFKKPYFIIANKASVVVRDPLKEVILDSETLYNTGFEDLKNTNTSVNGNVIPLTKIKI